MSASMPAESFERVAPPSARAVAGSSASKRATQHARRIGVASCRARPAGRRDAEREAIAVGEQPPGDRRADAARGARDHDDAIAGRGELPVAVPAIRTPPDRRRRH